MPRFRAKQDARLPDSIQGGTQLLAGDIVTVGGQGAVLLRQRLDLWEELEPPVLDLKPWSAKEALRIQKGDGDNATV